MNDFSFTFTWQDTDYSADCHVEGNDDADRQRFLVTVGDPGLQDRFGKELVFTWSNRMIFSWDTPEVDEAADYMRAVNMGLMEYLDENE